MSALPIRDRADQHQQGLILAALRDGVVLFGLDGRISWANKAALAMHGARNVAELGRTVQEYRQRFELRLRGHHRLPEGGYPMERALAGEAFDEVVVEVAPAGKKARWTHRVRNLVLNDAAGAPDCLVLILSDESERFEAEDRFETTFAADPAPALILQLSNHRYIKVNRGFLEMTGHAEAQVLGRSAYEIDILEGAARRELAIERLESGRAVPRMVSTLQLPGGGEKRVVVAGQPITVGGAACMLFSFVDLEEHKLTEDALRQSETSFTAALRLSPTPTFVAARADCRVMLANEAFVRTSGYAEADLVGRRMGEIGLWAEAAQGQILERQLRRDGAVREAEMRLRTREGGAVDCLVSAGAVTIGGQPCALVMAQDVTQQRRTEAEVVTAIEAVMQDTSWFRQAVLEKLTRMRRLDDAPPVDTAGLGDLPHRARQVLALVCRGMSDASIAKKLGIATNTVRNHIAALYRRTGVNGRTALVIWARDQGFDGGPPRKTPQRNGEADRSS